MTVAIPKKKVVLEDVALKRFLALYPRTGQIYPLTSWMLGPLKGNPLLEGRS